MCRFIAYQGPAITVDDLLYKPDHSLIKQSYDARELSEPLNGDGFGLGWYAPEVSSEPAVFTAITPAWNNRNLGYMASKIYSPAIFAHIRRASSGIVAENNCHPFHYKNMLMMHNGGVKHFGRIKRALLNKLSDERFDWIDGQTDTQHLFALFLDHYYAQGQLDIQGMQQAFIGMFKDLAELKMDAGLQDEASYLNMVVSNGTEMVGARYVDKADVTPLSLHHTEGCRYVCDEHGCRMHRTKAHEAVATIIASEPLTTEAEHWRVVPPNHFVVVDKLCKPKFVKISF